MGTGKREMASRFFRYTGFRGEKKKQNPIIIPLGGELLYGDYLLVKPKS